MPLLIRHWMPRVERDIRKLLNFVRRQPWGKPHDRELDIHRAFDEVYEHPEDNRPEVYLPASGLWLRRCRAAQFVVVYAYLPSKDSSAPGVVSIRAVRHVRERNVFEGVRESNPPSGWSWR